MPHVMALCGCSVQGVTALCSALRYQDIQQSIGAAQKASSQQKTCDSPLELLHYLQSDILEVASRLQRGGLGDLDDIGRFEDKVSTLCV